MKFTQTDNVRRMVELVLLEVVDTYIVTVETDDRYNSLHLGFSESENSENWDWEFVTFSSSWRIQEQKSILYGRDDNIKIPTPVVNKLKGSRVKKVDIYSPSYSIAFHIENHTLIPIFTTQTQSLDWALFSAEGRLLKMGPKISCHYQYLRQK